MVKNKPAMVVVLLVIGLAVIAVLGGYWNPFVKPADEAFQEGAAKPIVDDNTPPLPKIGLPNAVADEELLLDIEPSTAKEINDARPLSDVAIIAANPFGTKLFGIELERAQMCLAIAGIYEAGSNADDQRPVMQVVLNRVRHPAFPNSVCGVVFQGAERRTGCQFSFTCDGSMARHKHASRNVERAKALAGIMLRDGVDKRVGLATHYHTDWVVPYWSSSLDKLAQIKTHIFFNWKGYWGKKAAFKANSSQIEPTITKMAMLSAAHLPENAIAQEDDLTVIDPSKSEIAADENISGSGASKIAVVQAPKIPIKRLSLAANENPGRWSLEALKACGNLPECRVIGWANPAAAPNQLTKAEIANSPPDFVFVQELRNRIQTPHWDCEKWSKASTSQCLGKASERARLATGGQ